MMRLGLALAALVTLATAVDHSGALPTTTSATRVVDRAFECTNAKYRGFRKIRLFATSGYRHAGRWRWLGTVTVENPNEEPTPLPPTESGFKPTAFTEWSLGISAGTGPWTLDPALPKQEPGLSIWSKWKEACKPAPRRRVPLSARGLAGGAEHYFGDYYDCPAPRRVFARVRASFGSPTTFRLDHATATLKARAPVRTAALAVRTARGKPLAFGSVDEDGKAKIFLAASCTG